MFVGNLKETIELGKKFAKRLDSKSVVLLQGPIGAGKTSFVQGIAEGLSITEDITSPTFALSHHYNSGKSNWGEERYFKIAKSIYKDLDDRLEKSKFLAGEYSIADIATFPWLARHEWHDIGLKNYKNLSRWYEEISKRKAVIKGFDLLKRDETIPKI